MQDSSGSWCVHCRIHKERLHWKERLIGEIMSRNCQLPRSVRFLSSGQFQSVPTINDDQLDVKL